MRSGSNGFYSTYSFDGIFYGAGLATESQLKSCSVFWQTALYGPQKQIAGYSPIRVRRSPRRMTSKPQKPKRWWCILRWLGIAALIIFVGIFVGIPTVITTPVPRSTE